MNYLIYFIIGGTLMASLKLVAEQNSMISGILGALPLFSGVFLLLNILDNGKTVSQILAQARGSFFGMIIGVVFYLTICIVLYFRARSTEAFCVATGLSLVIVVIFTVVMRSFAHHL